MFIAIGSAACRIGAAYSYEPTKLLIVGYRMEPAVEGLGLRRRTGLVQIHWMPRQNFGSLLLINDIRFSSSSSFSSLNGIFLIGPKRSHRWKLCRPLSKRMLLSRNSQRVHHLASQVQYLHSTADELCFLLLLLLLKATT